MMASLTIPPLSRAHGLSDNHPSQTPLEPGTYAGDHIIDAPIGSGMFGTVYAAHHPLIDAPVAVKVLSQRYSQDPEMIGRFIHEARAASKARHPSIVEVFSFGRLPDGRRYLVMELLEGQGLDDRLSESPCLAPQEALRILRPIARGLAAAHAAGVTHRDVKPANIFLCADGPPKLVDFGVAKLVDPQAAVEQTRLGIAVGTPAYMAPEQCLGEAITPAVDVYALGTVAFRMLTGRLPFETDSPLEMMNAQIGAQPPAAHRLNSHLSPAVSAAVRAMLDKDPTRRPAPVAAVQALAHAIEHGPARRWRLAALVMGVGVAVGTVLAWPTDSALPEETVPGASATGVTQVRDAAPPADTGLRDAAVPDALAAPATEAVKPKVLLTFDGAPKGMQVRHGDEMLTRQADGRLSVSRSATTMRLTLSAPRHIDRVVEVTPTRSRSIDAQLRARPRPGKPAALQSDLHSIDPF